MPRETQSTYAVHMHTKCTEVLDGGGRTWSDALKEAVRLKRLLRPIGLQVHIYRESGPRLTWVKGWARQDRRSPWKPVKEGP